MALFSSSSSSSEVTTNKKNNKTSSKNKTIRKVLILPIPSEIIDPSDIHSVLPYLCQPHETIITYWTLPRTKERKVCVLIEG